MRLRIAQVTASGMAIRCLLWDQIQILQQQGHEVVAVCSPGKWADKIRAGGVIVETVSIPREPSPIEDLRAVFRLCRLFRRHRFDVVHTHTPKGGILAPLAARLAGVPVIIHTIHGLLFHDRMPWWKRCCFWLPEKWTAILSHYLLSQSGEDIDVAVRTHVCSRDKIFYVGNGIDLAHFTPQNNGARSQSRRDLGLADSDFVVGSVGRLVYEKGFAELFAAAEMLSHETNSVKFVVVGPTEEDRNDAVDPECIAKLGDSGVMRFLGWRDEVVSCYPAFDIFVLPSHREGIPRACLEASAMQRPVIATDIRGCREVVEHARTGLLVPVRNPAALAAAIQMLQRDPAQCQQMGWEGRQRIEKRFDSRMVLRRLSEFYARIDRELGQRRPRT